MPAKRELSMRQLRRIAASPWWVSAREIGRSWRGALDDPGQSETGRPGDAAHAVLAQGAAQAAEDAAALVDCLEAADERSVEEHCDSRP
jgi:hypothetical protein